MENPKTMRFMDLPLGTRFKLKDTEDSIWVKLSHDGTIAEWTGYVGVFPGQLIVSATETDEERLALEVTVAEASQ